MSLNVFENFPLNNDAFYYGGTNRCELQLLDIPDSIIFNTVAIIISHSAASSGTVSFSFGLYSITGATLTLVNSASASLAFATASFISHLTLATSATSNITPGNWIFGFMSNTSNDSRIRYLIEPSPVVGGGAYGGPFFRGFYSTTNALLESIETTISDLIKDGGVGATGVNIPYVLICA